MFIFKLSNYSVSVITQNEVRILSLRKTDMRTHPIIKQNNVRIKTFITSQYFQWC